MAHIDAKQMISSVPSSAVTEEHSDLVMVGGRMTIGPCFDASPG